MHLLFEKKHNRKCHYKDVYLHILNVRCCESRSNNIAKKILLLWLHNRMLYSYTIADVFASCWLILVNLRHSSCNKRCKFSRPCVVILNEIKHFIHLPVQRTSSWNTILYRNLITFILMAAVKRFKISLPRGMNKSISVAVRHYVADSRRAKWDVALCIEKRQAKYQNAVVECCARWNSIRRFAKFKFIGGI